MFDREKCTCLISPPCSYCVEEYCAECEREFDECPHGFTVDDPRQVESSAESQSDRLRELLDAEREKTKRMGLQVAELRAEVAELKARVESLTAPTPAGKGKPILRVVK